MSLFPVALIQPHLDDDDFSELEGPEDASVVDILEASVDGLEGSTGGWLQGHVTFGSFDVAAEQAHPGPQGQPGIEEEGSTGCCCAHAQAEPQLQAVSQPQVEAQAQGADDVVPVPPVDDEDFWDELQVQGSQGHFGTSSAARRQVPGLASARTQEQPLL